MPASPRYCRGCGRQRRTGEWSCPACHGDLYGLTVPGDARGAGVRLEDAPPLRGLLAGVLDVPYGAWALLVGEPGAGKTTIGLGCLVDPWVCSSEMDPELVIAYADRLGARLSGISVLAVDVEGRTCDLGIPPSFTGDILIDSISEGGDPLVILAAIDAAIASGKRRAFVACQVTKDGAHAGPAKIKHESAIAIELRADVDHQRLTVVKNRHGRSPITLLYRLGARGAELPTWAPRFYSVEGRGGAFRIVSYPAEDRAVYADPWRALEAGKLPDPPSPPVATAARASKLYPSGYAHPADVDARRAFAVAHGLAFYLPPEPIPDAD